MMKVIKDIIIYGLVILCFACAFGLSCKLE